MRRLSPEPSAEPREMNVVDAVKKKRAMRTMMKMRRMSGRMSRKDEEKDDGGWDARARKTKTTVHGRKN